MSDEEHFLRRRRAALGLSQGDLALRLKSRGVKLSRNAVSLWERRKRRPQLTTVDKQGLADALRWSVEELERAIDAENAHYGVWLHR